MKMNQKDADTPPKVIEWSTTNYDIGDIPKESTWSKWVENNE